MKCPKCNKHEVRCFAEAMKYCMGNWCTCDSQTQFCKCLHSKEAHIDRSKELVGCMNCNCNKFRLSEEISTEVKG